MARVGTWNLGDLFSHGEEHGPGSEQEYEAKVAAIVEIVGRLDVDVLALQEVGSEAALDDVASRLGAPWHHSLADPDERGIRVGFLARSAMRDPEQFPFHAPKLPEIVVDDEGTTTGELSRPGLRITVELDGVDVQLVTVHFASKRPRFPNGSEPDDEDQRARYAAYALARRAAEATTTRILANQLLRGDGSGRPLIVLGDLNDTEHAASTTILEGPGGSEDAGWRLWNLGHEIPAEQRYSRVDGERRELIDHIFVSHALFDGRGDVATHDPGDGSDHRPVTADLAPTPATESASAPESQEGGGESDAASPPDSSGEGETTSSSADESGRSAATSTSQAGGTESTSQAGGTESTSSTDRDQDQQRAETESTSAQDGDGESDRHEQTSGARAAQDGDDDESGRSEAAGASSDVETSNGDESGQSEAAGASSDGESGRQEQTAEAGSASERDGDPSGSGEPSGDRRPGFVERAKSFFGRSSS